MGLLTAMGVGDREVLRGVREDVERKRFHVACNRVFDHVHRVELRRGKEEGGEGGGGVGEVIVHPNTWFKRSFLLRNPGLGGAEGVEMEM